ncbi:MAG: hypothetical protein GEU81_17010 [Nitriliruptorales bacterium]|nr:hypothetical protein [Nitriliruptorales bacterium]
MEDAGRAIIKWTIVIIILTAVVAYAIQEIPGAFQAGVEFVDDEEDQESLAEEGEAIDEEVPDLPTGPVSAGAATPEVDFSVAGGQVNRRDSDELLLGSGDGDAVVVSFPLIEGDPNCVEGVRLELEIRQATETELGAYPSGLFDPDEVQNDAPPPGDLLLHTSAGALSFTNGTPGRLPWDVTELYRTWATGAPFGEDGEQAPVGSPFVVVVKATDDGAPGRSIQFGSMEAGEQAPTLTWTGIAECGEDEGEAPDDVEGEEDVEV